MEGLRFGGMTPYGEVGAAFAPGKRAAVPSLRMQRTVSTHTDPPSVIQVGERGAQK